jgi:hypothetical protein
MRYKGKVPAHLRSTLMITAAASALLSAFSAGPVGAHFPTTQGATAVNPNSGAPGASVNVSATGAQQAPYSVMFAEPSQVMSFEEGGGGEGHKEACAHGSPIAGPYTPDAQGTINPVSVTIPPSSPGRALICFETANSLTKPVEFTVQGGGGMGGMPGMPR